MPKPMKRHGFLPPVPRLLTRRDQDAYDLIHFHEAEIWSEESGTTLCYPDSWSLEAAQLLVSEAAYDAQPTRLKVIEENTVPSWLWRHSSESSQTTAEHQVQQIFNRVVGAAVYAGWKKNLFANESEARAFFDEARYALATRTLAIDPHFLGTIGLEWAYGTQASSAPVTQKQQAEAIEITNPMIDAIVSGSTNKSLRSQWQRILHSSSGMPASLRFADISNEWGHSTEASLPLMIDLLALRHNDGSVNIDSLRHLVTLAVTLLDLLDISEAPNLALGFCNLTALLMALGLPYDSEAGCMTAASLTAILTAQATITSAQLAALRGTSAAFTAERETILRRLRNHRRAAYGDQNDYEKISVLPRALSLTAGLDLTLVAAAQHLWDDALDLARLYGLRHTQLTSLNASPRLALFMESSTQGVDALSSLMLTRSDNGETFSQIPHPCLLEAMTRLGYNSAQSKAITTYATGHRTLDKAPTINHTILRERGFSKAVLERMEAYLPYVNTIRLAFTPWILGQDFCHETLGLSVKQIENPAFDLLQHLKFSAADVSAANAYYYGYGSVRGAKELGDDHASVFAGKADVSPEAHIRMAAAVQGFLSGDVSLALELSDQVTAERAEALVLSAWRQGLKTLVLSGERVIAHDAPQKAIRKPRRKLATSLHTQQPNLPHRASKTKASRRIVGMGSARSKSGVYSRSKSR